MFCTMSPSHPQNILKALKFFKKQSLQIHIAHVQINCCHANKISTSVKRITKHSDYKYWIGSTNIDLAIFPNSVTTFTLLKNAKMSAKIKVKNSLKIDISLSFYIEKKFNGISSHFRTYLANKIMSWKLSYLFFWLDLEWF